VSFVGQRRKYTQHSIRRITNSLRPFSKVFVRVKIQESTASFSAQVVNGSTPASADMHAEHTFFPPHTRRTGGTPTVASPEMPLHQDVCLGDRTMRLLARACLDLDYLDAELTASRRRSSLGSGLRSGTEYILDLESGKMRSEESNSHCDGSTSPKPSRSRPSIKVLLLEWEMHAGLRLPGNSSSFRSERRSLEMPSHCLIYSAVYLFQSSRHMALLFWLWNGELALHCVRNPVCSASCRPGYLPRAFLPFPLYRDGVL
jgi:hypothetical protein